MEGRTGKGESCCWQLSIGRTFHSDNSVSRCQKSCSRGPTTYYTTSRSKTSSHTLHFVWWRRLAFLWRRLLARREVIESRSFLPFSALRAANLHAPIDAHVVAAKVWPVARGTPPTQPWDGRQKLEQLPAALRTISGKAPGLAVPGTGFTDFIANGTTHT